MKHIFILFCCLFTISQNHAQIISYPVYKYGDGTNKPFDKEFDLLIPFKKQESIYYDFVYLYRHKGNRSLRESIGKTKPPTIKLNANWEKNKTSDSTFLKVEFRYNPDLKEYSLLKPSGIYSIIIFNGATKKSKSLVKALRNEYTATGDIKLNGPAYIEFQKIISQQKLDTGINTYNEDFNKYIEFFKKTLLPKETEIIKKTKEDLDYTFTCNGNFFSITDLSVLLNLAKGTGCNAFSVDCFDTCKVTNMIPLLNSFSCTNILDYIKGYTVLNKIGKNDEYATHDNFELRRINLEHSLNELNDLKSITQQLRTQLQTIQVCKNQLSSIIIIDSWLSDVIEKLLNSKKRLEKCLQINPLLSQANHLLGNVLRDLRSFDLAIDSYKKEISLNPNYPDVLNDLGILHFIKDEFDMASDAYDQAIKIDSSYADPYQNKAMIHVRQKQFDEAKKLLELSIKLKANNYEAIAVLANLKKYICEFDGAWNLYQHRFELELKDEKKHFKKPVWTDQFVKGKRIYLYAEQGIGDQILFGTMFRDAFETQNNFIVSIDKRLLPIFNRSFTQYKNVEFIPKDDEVNDTLFDLQLAIGDLGKFFRKSKDDFKAIAPRYLQSDEVKRNALRDQFINRKKKFLN
jgi:tetratricopeptide (TPR) repeat protein